MGVVGVPGAPGVVGESPRFRRRLARDSALDFSSARFFARRASSSSFAWAKRAARAACAVARARERERGVGVGDGDGDGDGEIYHFLVGDCLQVKLKWTWRELQQHCNFCY